MSKKTRGQQVTQGSTTKAVPDSQKNVIKTLNICVSRLTDKKKTATERIEDASNILKGKIRTSNKFLKDNLKRSFKRFHCRPTGLLNDQKLEPSLGGLGGICINILILTSFTKQT